MAKCPLDKQLKQLVRQANTLCDLGDAIATEEFFIGVAGALLSNRGVQNGKEKITSKKRKFIKQSDTRSREEQESGEKEGRTFEGEFREI